MRKKWTEGKVIKYPNVLEQAKLEELQWKYYSEFWARRRKQAAQPRTKVLAEESVEDV